MMDIMESLVKERAKRIGGVGELTYRRDSLALRRLRRCTIFLAGFLMAALVAERLSCRSGNAGRALGVIGAAEPGCAVGKHVSI